MGFNGDVHLINQFEGYGNGSNMRFIEGIQLEFHGIIIHVMGYVLYLIVFWD
jgi:hypothetical protein